MNLKKITLIAVAASALTACTNIDPQYLLRGQIIKQDVTVDTLPGEVHTVADMRAGIWIDGNGCEHWIIDDGIEGYMSPRFGSNKLPVCSADNIPFTTRDFSRSGFGSESKNNYN